MEFSFFEDFRFILASGSPRRRELLSLLGLHIDVIIPEGGEDFDEKDDPREVAMLLAERKCKGLPLEPALRDVIIAADTIVFCDGRILNKPGTEEEAKEYLQFLSGKWHSVITGVAILFRGRIKLFSTETKVAFGNLEQSEIRYYVERFSPYDKAGAYGIQEWIGMIGIREIRGCYYNVMGLPVFDLYSNLKLILNNKNRNNESEN